jgi:serine/threonine-protein kinase HipA
VKHAPTGLLDIFLEGRTRRKVGRLAAQSRRILFEYDQAFLASGLNISPCMLPAQPGTVVGNPAVFEGLFGVFNDSLPDGWGRLLLDRAVEKLGFASGELRPLDRLALVGRDGMGALSYEPDKSKQGDATTTLKLDALAKDAAVVLAGEEGPVIEKLLRLAGASAGVRPKIVAQVSANKKRIIHGPAGLPDGYSHWIIKFPSIGDATDIGPVEYAYSLMSRDAGVDMPATHLFGANKKRYFGIKRFDRDGDRRIHMHSLSGLLHADHRVASLDYDAFLKATHVLTKDVAQLEKAFRLACFNVLAHNRDDHAKNVSFLMDDDGRWVLAPAYDLTFSFGPGGEQSMTVMGEGKSPGVVQLRALGKKHALKNAGVIIEQVQSAVNRWQTYADDGGVTAKSAKMIAARIAPPAKKVVAAKPKAAKKPVSKKKPATANKTRRSKKRK